MSPQHHKLNNCTPHDVFSMIRKIGFQTKDMIIGDTEIDIAVGRKLGMQSIAVASGIRTSHFLKQLKPDSVIKSILQLSMIGNDVI